MLYYKIVDSPGRRQAMRLRELASEDTISSALSSSGRRKDQAITNPDENPRPDNVCVYPTPTMADIIQWTRELFQKGPQRTDPPSTND